MTKANPLILGLETATLAGSVCLARGGAILSSRIGDARTSHSNTLLRDINDLLELSGIALSEIDLFAAAVGPGSFTGLRIGLATTKALAATLSRRCLSVPTLHAVASTAGSVSNVVALLPAGRGQVFTQLFSVSGEGDVSPRDEPAHLPPGKMLERYSELNEVLWVGEATALHGETIRNYSSDHSLQWTVAPVVRDLARHVALIGLRSYFEDKAVTPASLQAIYVQPSDAELKTNVINN